MTNISQFGIIPSTNQKIFNCELINTHGMRVSIINYGAIIRSIELPDENQNLNVVLGYDTLEQYLLDGHFVGAQIGPLSNRISNSGFSKEGYTWKFKPNEGTNLLHGGELGFHNQVWEIEQADDTSAVLKLDYDFKSIDQSTRISSRIYFKLDDQNCISIEMEATANLFFPFNLTRHEYFNLNGGGDILNHQLQLNAHSYTPVDKGLIPEGKIVQIENTPYDFRVPKSIREAISQLNTDCCPLDAFDNNLVLNGNNSFAARLVSDNQKWTLEISTTQPCLQFYTGHGLDNGHQPFSGLCLEAQGFPDGPNQITFPQNFYDSNKRYNQSISYTFLNQ